MLTTPKGLCGLVFLSLVINCSDQKKDKPQSTVPPLALSQNCKDIPEGQSTSLTYYKKERAALHETCASLEVKVMANCEKGQLATSEPGFPVCTETLLQKLALHASATKVIVGGAPVLLTVDAVDQDGQSLAIDASLVSWVASDPNIEISADGHVVAKAAAPNVVIRATVQGQIAEITLTAEDPTIAPPVIDPNPRKDCGETKDGEAKGFPRYRSAVVNFLTTCEAYEANALCDDGTFIFKPEDGIAECRVAQVKEFKVNPEALKLVGGQTFEIMAEAVDETGFRGAVPGDRINWSIKAAADDAEKISIKDGAITLTSDLIEDAQITAIFASMNATLSLAKADIQVTSIAFDQTEYLAKVGDVLDLKVLGFAAGKPVALSPEKITLESSDAAKLSIEGGAARILTPGGLVMLTAKYADGTLLAQTKVRIEDALTLTSTPAKKDVITAETYWIVALTQMTIQGPMKDKAPVLSETTKACTFNTYLIHGKWMVDVKLQAGTNEAIPASCEAVVTAESVAGQKVSQSLKAPIQFAELKFQDMSGTSPARLDYRLSSNIKITKPSIVRYRDADLTPVECQMQVVQKEGQLEVSLVNPAATPFCAAFLAYNLEIDGKSTIRREPVTVSPYKPFIDSCNETQDAAIQKTIKALSQALNIRQDCVLMDALLRRKNVDAAFGSTSSFALSLASHQLTDLSPLARLTGLAELILSDNRGLSDLQPLNHLMNLKRIDVDFTDVQDFSPLYRLKRLNLFYSDKEKIDCKKSEVANAPLKNICTQE